MPATRTYQGVTYEQQADGTWRRQGAGQQGPQPIVLSQGDPMQPAQSRADVNNTQANTQRTVTDTNITNATAPTTIVRNDAPEGFMWVDPNNPSAGVLRIPGYVPPPPPGQAEEERGRVSRLNQLTNQINRTQELFNEGPGSTRGVLGWMDLLPTPGNSRFDTAGATLSQQGLAAFRVPGTGNVSDRDAIMFDRANMPTASNYDQSIDEQLRGMRARVEEEYQSLGLPAPQWVQPPERFRDQQDNPAIAGAVGGPPPGPSALDQVFAAPPIAPVPSGDRGMISANAYPDGYDAAHRQMVAGLIGGGNFDPQVYAQARSQLDQQFGVQSDPAANLEWGNSLKSYLDSGGHTPNTGVGEAERPMTGMEILRDDLVNNPVGAAITGAGNMGSFGLVERFAGDQYGALGDSQPMGTTIGEMAGVLAPTAAIGRIGAATLGRAAPRLMGSGTLASMGRGALADATYGATYGAVTDRNIAQSAAEASIGSLLGQTVGRTIGAAGRGAIASQPVQNLIDRGVNLSLGQRLGQGASRWEERLASMPFVGDNIRARRVDAIGDLNRTAINEAGAPINFTTNAIGDAGLSQFDTARGNAYENIRFDNGSIPLDAQFAQDLAGAIPNSLPRAGRRRMGEVLDAHIQPVADAGQMDAEAFIRARRGLSAARNSVPESFTGFDNLYRDGVGAARDALDNQVGRSGETGAVDSLLAANTANRNYETLMDAARRAERGGPTGEPFVFGPGQLQAASQAAQRNYPGPAPLGDLSMDAVRVMSDRVPNSGTPERLAAMLVGGGLIGGGAGAYSGGDIQSAAEGGVTGASVPLIATLLMAAATSGRGNRALSAAAMNRNPTVREFSEKLLRRSGLFGSAAVPLALSRD